MAGRPWYRLDPGFLTRATPRASRTRISLAGADSTGNGAALLRRGLAARFAWRRGRLLVQPADLALLAARERRLLCVLAARVPDHRPLLPFLRAPNSRAGRKALESTSIAGIAPVFAALHLYAGDRAAARRCLAPSPDAPSSALVEIAQLWAGPLDELAGALDLLAEAERRVDSTTSALAVASGWCAVGNDRAAAARVLEAAETRSSKRHALARLAWGWGALLGDTARARSLLDRADRAPAPEGGAFPSVARHWRLLLDDDARARASLEAFEAGAAGPADWTRAAEEWLEVFDDRTRALAAARKGAASAPSPVERLMTAAPMKEAGDRAGARAVVEEAAKAARGDPYLQLRVAETRATVLGDRKRAAAAAARVIEKDADSAVLPELIEQALRSLGAGSLRPAFERREKKAATFEDRLACARVRARHFKNPRARARHVKAAADLAREAREVQELARVLREDLGEPERATAVLDEALARAATADDWTALLSDRFEGDDRLFLKHWPRAAALAGPGRWQYFLSVCSGFSEPDCMRAVLDALAGSEGDAGDWLRASEELLRLGERDRAEQALERAEREQADPLTLAEAWAKVGAPERAALRIAAAESAPDPAAGDLCRCARAWHATGDAARARLVLERASSAAREIHEHQECARAWRDLFGDLARAEESEAKAATARKADGPTSDPLWMLSSADPNDYFESLSLTDPIGF